MRFIIVTGMSGAGRGTSLKMLEDMGYFCVDNLPISLVEIFAELVYSGNSEITKAALGLDIRSGQQLETLQQVMEHMTISNQQFEILFLDASDEVLLKRYKETRRMHPLAVDGHIVEGIQEERQRLIFLKKQADYILDTSNLLTRELKVELDKIFVQNQEFQSLMISIQSFGFKFGIPGDADLVFDVRFLPNPYYYEELRPLSGNDKEIQDFVMGFEATHVFLDKLTDMLQFLMPNYILEGKNQLVIAIGCTGGKHRSVTLANKLYERLQKYSEYGVRVEHRDIQRETYVKSN